MQQGTPRQAIERFPLLPLAEGRLDGVRLRESFIERVSCHPRPGEGTCYRWRAMLMEDLGVMGTRGKHVNVLQHLSGPSNLA